MTRRAIVLLLPIFLALPLLSTPTESNRHARRILAAYAIDESEMVRVQERIRAGDWMNPIDFYNYGPLDYYLAAPLDSVLGRILPAGPGVVSAILALRLVSFFSFGALFLLAARTDRFVPFLFFLLVPEFFYYVTRAHPDMLQLVLLYGAYRCAADRPRAAAALLALAASTKLAGFILLPALLFFPPRSSTVRERFVWIAIFLAVLVATQPRLLFSTGGAASAVADHAARNFAWGSFSPTSGSMGWAVWPFLLLAPIGLGGVVPLLGVVGFARPWEDDGDRRFAAAWTLSFLAFLLLAVRSDFGARHLFPLLPPLLDAAARGYARPRTAPVFVLLFVVALVSGSALWDRARAMAEQSEPRRSDHAAFADVPADARLWSEYKIDVPPPLVAECYFGGRFPDDLGDGGVPAFLSLRPDGARESELRARGYSPVRRTGRVEVWRHK